MPSVIESLTGDNLFGAIRREKETGLPKIFILFRENLKLSLCNSEFELSNRLYYEMHFGMQIFVIGILILKSLIFSHSNWTPLVQFTIHVGLRDDLCLGFVNHIKEIKE